MNIFLTVTLVFLKRLTYKNTTCDPVTSVISVQLKLNVQPPLAE